MTETLTIQQGFKDELRVSAARLYDEAFGSKLGLAIKDQDSRIAILSEGFNPENSLVALEDGEVVGIAGFNTGRCSLTSGITFRVLKKHLGLFGAVWTALLFSMFERKPGEKQLLMDGLSVSARMRGMGIGTKLLTELKTFAKNEGYESIRLDVIDTNPGALRLYERFGFQAVKTTRFENLRAWIGFGAVTEMKFRCPPGIETPRNVC